jgi:hypothetical protein
MFLGSILRNFMSWSCAVDLGHVSVRAGVVSISCEQFKKIVEENLITKLE